MIDNVHAYTSITSNYLPKARVLAESVKRLDPGLQLHLVLPDNAPVGFNLASLYKVLREAFPQHVVFNECHACHSIINGDGSVENV